MQHIKQTILTLVALIAVTTGAWAETGENIFQYCYDCQRNPAYPKTTASASLSGFKNPYVGYKGSGFGMDNTSAGPWKLEYVGLWSTTDKHGIDDYSVSNYQSTYNCTDVPVFRLYQWNATANEYQHAAYGVVCAYAKVSNAVEHTALFVAQGGWGCVLTNSSHSSSMNITFDEDLSTGLTTLIAAATPNASSGSTFEVAWDNDKKTGSFTMPGGNVELEPEYYPQAALTAKPTAIDNVPATTDGAIVNAGTVANIGETTNAQGTVMYYAVQSATAPTAPDYDATGWTDKVPTATDFAEGNVYVWYYVKGAEPASVADRTDANTCSDSEITALGTTGYVTLLAAPKYNAEFAFDEGTPDAEKAKWGTNIPDGGVVKGTAVTVTYTGSKKVLGVKAEKNTAYAANEYNYAEWDYGDKKVIFTKRTAASVTAVTNSGTDVTWGDGWYTVSGNVTINGKVTLSANTSLILQDGATLTINGQLNASDNDLYIYGQMEGTGKLNITCNDDAIKDDGGESLYIHGGEITATATGDSHHGLYFGYIEMYSGKLTATAADYHAIGFDSWGFRVYGGEVEGTSNATSGNYNGIQSDGSLMVYGGKVKGTGSAPNGIGFNCKVQSATSNIKFYFSNDGATWGAAFNYEYETLAPGYRYAKAE